MDIKDTDHTDVMDTGHPSDIRRWAACAWWEMERFAVLPTPANFDLWFRHVNGSDRKLSDRIAARLNEASVISSADLMALHADFPGSQGHLDELVDQADGMQEAAQTIVDKVMKNGRDLQGYGSSLSHWTARLSQNPTVDTLAQAVGTLAAETAKASERNHTLEQQLSAASARIARLQNSMVNFKKEATTDNLTGLCNRKAFNMRLRRALVEAKADGIPVSVLMLDVDHFKRVNDTYGHQAGDMVLRLIGRLLSQNVKGRDTSARYGGEEFAVLLVGADLKAGVIVANQIRAAMESKQLIGKQGNGSDRITISVGVAQFQPNETAGLLLDRADVAMYQAKQGGRNRVFATPHVSWE